MLCKSSGQTLQPGCRSAGQGGPKTAGRARRSDAVVAKSIKGEEGEAPASLVDAALADMTVRRVSGAARVGAPWSDRSWQRSGSEKMKEFTSSGIKASVLRFGEVADQDSFAIAKRIKQ